MGSGRLLQRMDFMAVLIDRLGPKRDEIPDLLGTQRVDRGWPMLSYKTSFWGPTKTPGEHFTACFSL